MKRDAATRDSSPTTDALPSFQLQPLRALRALHQLSQNPADIAQGFVIVDSLAGRAPLRVLARFRADPVGQKLLRLRPDLLSSLRDHAALERMPGGSLAHAYLSFLERGGISADGLIQASVVGREKPLDRTSDFLFVRERIRDSHDLWHAVTGYGADVVGEVALLSFNVAQLQNPGIAAVMALATLANLRNVLAGKVITRAFRRGLAAAWLPPVHWEALLPRPLADVRRMLRVASGA
ncbi:MAG: hypothetical protein JWN48_387 [Myxococcaceae bacterium]|nr:hypothetical protein [Myxococcaceae bacterium]